MTPHRLYAIRLVAITVTAIIAFGCFAIAASARTRPDRMPQIGQVTVHYNANLVEECGDEDAIGCAAPWDGDIWIGRRANRMTLAHEIGHVFIWRALGYTFAAAGDPVVSPAMQWAEDQIIATLDQAPGTEFWGEGDSPAEQAAEAYAVCDTGNGPHWGRVKVRGRMVRTLWMQSMAYDYAPDLRMHLSMCSLFHKIERAAA